MAPGLAPDRASSSVVLTALTPPLGAYMARVFQGERVLLTPVLGPVERLTYRVAAASSPDAGRTGRPTPARCSSSALSPGCCST